MNLLNKAIKIISKEQKVYFLNRLILKDYAIFHF